MRRAARSCGTSARAGRLLEQLPPAFASAWPSGARTPRDGAARRSTRSAVPLVQRTAQWLGEGRVTEEAAVRLVNWLEPLLRRESYLALLLERPAVHEQLLHLLGAAGGPRATCCSTPA
jgi:glutamate-ammonia-ligase adenylyltransferase